MRREPVIGVLALRTEALLSDTDIRESALRLVRPERRNKTEQYRQPKDRALSLGAGLLLRYASLCAGMSGREYWELPLSFGGYGKPYFAGREDFVFNLSHSGQLAVCTYVCGVKEKGDTGDGGIRLGCDTEQLRPLHKGVMRRCFTDGEQRWVMEAEGGGENGTGKKPGERGRRFTRLWTLKESFAKAEGGGLALPLKRLELYPALSAQSAPGADCIAADYDGRTFYFREYDPGEAASVQDGEYCLSVCGSLPGFAPRVRLLTVQELCAVLEGS